jgi:hypothetical protein
VRELARRVWRGYGSHPVHLLTLLACFALTGYVVSHLASQPLVLLMLIWFVGAVVLHDLVLFTIYALADRSLRAGLRALRPRPAGTPAVSSLNYLRVPALGTGLLFLVFFPGILRQGQLTYQAATGQTQEPYLRRWLLLTAALFAISAVSYALRLRHARSARRRS